jgi:hypothetical protein
LAGRNNDLLDLINSQSEKFNQGNLELKKEFLIALCYGNSISATCQILGIVRQRIYSIKKNDIAFSNFMDELLQDLDFAKVKDIENDLLSSANEVDLAADELFNNGFYFEALAYKKECHRVKDRYISRQDQIQFRRENAQSIANKEQTTDATNINISIGGDKEKLPNGIPE